MNSIDDVKKHVATLVEANRALSTDLDSSRRAVAAIGRERDALRRELERLQSAHLSEPAPESARCRRTSMDSDYAPPVRGRYPRGEAAESRDPYGREFSRQRADWDGRDWRSARSSSLVTSLRRAEQERDVALEQLDEALAAMADITSCLERSLQSAR